MSETYGEGKGLEDLSAAKMIHVFEKTQHYRQDSHISHTSPIASADA